MREEVTEENLKKLINWIPEDTTAVERAILFNNGTVQTLLSCVLRTPIHVEVIAQVEFDAYIIRWARLVADDKTVCLAESVIDKRTSYSGFINGIREKNIGIGQLLTSLHIQTAREVLGIYVNKTTFSRAYKIRSEKIDGDSTPLIITITEVFFRDAI